MQRILMLPLMLLALALPAVAQEDQTTVADPIGDTPDPRVRALLDELGYQYEIDDDGDYRAVFEFTGEKRSQVVYVNSRTSEYDGLEIREVWSPAIEAKGQLAQKIANRLLEASFDAPLGGWQTIKRNDGKVVAVFAVKLGASADAQTLKKAMNAVLVNADNIEKELSKKDVY